MKENYLIYLLRFLTVYLPHKFAVIMTAKDKGKSIIIFILAIIL